jgi:hypothetical protein
MELSVLGLAVPAGLVLRYATDQVKVRCVVSYVLGFVRLGWHSGTF